MSMYRCATTPALPETTETLVERVQALETRVASLPTPDTMCLCVFSGELDRLLAAFNIATGAAASGSRVSMFFTFWATPALMSREKPRLAGKSIVEKLFGWMLPTGVSKSKLSRLDMAGIGRRLMLREMRKKRLAGLDELLTMAMDLRVEIHVCSMSMELMGIDVEELIDYPGLKVCGVAQYNEVASSSTTTLFI